MRALVFTVFLFAAGSLPLIAGQRSSPIPLRPPPPAHAPQPQCVDARDTADYVPGVDAYGRAVAPADLPGSTTDVQISTQMYIEMRSRNPQVQGVGVVANLPGLQKPPACLNPQRSGVTIR